MITQVASLVIPASFILVRLHLLNFPGLNGEAAGIADAFLQDVAAGGGKIQQVSEDSS